MNIDSLLFNHLYLLLEYFVCSTLHRIVNKLVLYHDSAGINKPLDVVIL